MGLNRKCPKCGRSKIEHADYDFTSRMDGMRFWCVCEWCGHKWKEHYDLRLVRPDQPWTKPPKSKEWI